MWFEFDIELIHISVLPLLLLKTSYTMRLSGRKDRESMLFSSALKAAASQIVFRLSWVTKQSACACQVTCQDYYFCTLLLSLLFIYKVNALFSFPSSLWVILIVVNLHITLIEHCQAHGTSPLLSEVAKVGVSRLQELMGTSTYTPNKSLHMLYRYVCF